MPNASNNFGLTSRRTTCKIQAVANVLEHTIPILTEEVVRSGNAGSKVALKKPLAFMTLKMKMISMTTMMMMTVLMTNRKFEN